MVAVTALAIASYNKVFTSVVNVTLETGRAGLLTNPGADVRMRGLSVGEVRDVQLSDDGERVLLDLALNKETVEFIPSGVRAALRPSTVFGAKFVSLQKPSGPVVEPISAGEVVEGTDVTTEINNVFLGLKEVLETVEPAKIRATLGSMAETLRGRGAELGTYLSQVNSYLERLNRSLGTLRSDISASAEVVEIYANVAPELLATADSATTTSATLAENRASLDALLLDFTRTAGEAGTFFDRLEEPLTNAMDIFQPVLGLLAEYSPEFTCLVKGLNEVRERVSVFGTYVSGAQAFVSFLPGQEGYKYPRDLQQFVTGDGPDCFSLPFVSRKEAPVPRIRFDDGSNAVFRHPSDVSTPEEVVAVYPELLFKALFGVSAQEALGVPLSEVLPKLKQTVREVPR